MDLAHQVRPTDWYRLLVSEVDINTVQGAAITAGTVIVVGGLVSLGIVLALAPIAATSRVQDGTNMEAVVQVLPIEVREDEAFDKQDDRIDAIRPRRSLVVR